MLKKIKKKKESVFYLIIIFSIYIIYYLFDMKTSANTNVKQVLSRGNVHIFMFMLIGILIFYFIMHLKKFKYMNIVPLLIILDMWIFIVDMLNNSSIWNIIVRIGLLTLWFLTFFFSSTYINSIKKYLLLQKFEIVIWGITICYFFVSLINYSKYRSDTQTNVLNISYNLLVLLPFLLQIENKKISKLMTGITILLIMISMKRGAIISMVVMLFMYSYLNNFILNRRVINRKKLKKIILFLIIMAISIFIINEYTNGFFLSRFTKQALLNGSNRGMMYSCAWQDILERSIFQLIVGKGSTSVLEIIGSGVHNELLEFLFSYGIIGCGIYILLVIKGIRTIIFMAKKRMSGTPYYAMGITFIILVGIFGTSLFGHYTFHIMLLLGVAYKYLNKIEI